MTVLYRLGLPLFIVLIGVAPTRAQNPTGAPAAPRGADPDSVTILELRRVPRSGGEGRLLRRLAPSVRERVLISDSDRVEVRRLPGRRALFLGDSGQPDLPMRFEMPALRMHLDTLLGDGTRFRIHMDSLMGDRSAFRMSLDSLRGAHRIHFDSLKRHMGALRVEGRPMMRFRMGGPEGRMRPSRPRGMAPRMRFKEGPGMQRELRIERRGDGTVVIERDGRRMMRPGEGDGEVMRAPGARIDQRVIRLDRDGEVIEGGEGVRVERDADGGLRIYVPPQPVERARTPAPPRTRPRG